MSLDFILNIKNGFCELFNLLIEIINEDFDCISQLNQNLPAIQHRCIYHFLINCLRTLDNPFFGIVIKGIKINVIRL